MGKPTIKGLTAELDALAIKYKQSIAAVNALRRQLDEAKSGRAHGTQCNMQNPAFRAAFDALRAEHPDWKAIDQQLIVDKMQSMTH